MDSSDSYSVSTSSDYQKSTLCYAFLQDKCYNEECQRIHPAEMAKKKRAESLKKKTCIRNKNGICHMKYCPYLHPIYKHDKVNSIDNASETESQSDNDSKSNVSVSNSKRLSKKYKTNNEEFNSTIMDDLKKFETLFNFEEEEEKLFPIVEYLVKEITPPTDVLRCIMDQPELDDIEDLTFWQIFQLMNSKKQINNVFDMRLQKAENISYVFWDIQMYSKSRSLEYIWIFTQKSFESKIMYKILYENGFNFMVSTNHLTLSGYWIKI